MNVVVVSTFRNRCLQWETGRLQPSLSQTELRTLCMSRNTSPILRGPPTCSILDPPPPLSPSYSTSLKSAHPVAFFFKMFPNLPASHNTPPPPILARATVDGLTPGFEQSLPPALLLPSLTPSLNPATRGVLFKTQVRSCPHFCLKPCSDSTLCSEAKRLRPTGVSRIAPAPL